MKRTIAAAVLIVATVAGSATAKGLKIPRGHRHDPPKTVEDQNRENAERDRKRQEQQQKNQPPPPPPQPRPTTSPSTLIAKAQRDLDTVEKRLRTAFEKGDDYVSASAALKSAQDSYDVAYATMVVKLGDTPDYAAAVRAQKQAESDAAAARRDGQATADSAGRVMEARKTVHKLESDAADKDDTVKAAKAKVAEAKTAVDDLRKAFQEKMKEDPDYLAALEAVEEAKAKKA